LAYTPPSTESIIETIKSTSGEQVVSRGATEANVLGLTTQLPAREVFLTSGPARKQQLGKRQMELIQGPKWAALVLGAQLSHVRMLRAFDRTAVGKA
jgi:hypothetical protein